MTDAKHILNKMESGESNHKKFTSEDAWRIALPKPTNSDDLKIETVFGKLIAKLDGTSIGSFDPNTNTGSIHNDHVKKSLMHGVTSSEEAGEKSADAFMDKL
jgi:hypothetical protein